MGTKISELTEQTAPANTDLVEISEDLGGGSYASKKMQLSNLATVDKLSANTTVNFTSSQTAAQIQASIDAQPKNLNGYTLTFQFGDGTYTLNNKLDFLSFFNGTLNIYGNTTETNNSTLHTTQLVILNSSSGSSHGLFVYGCHCKNILIRNFNILVADGANLSCIYAASCSDTHINYNYVRAVGKTSVPMGINVSAGNAAASSNYISNVERGIHIDRGIMLSATNDDTSTAPNYGLMATGGGVIGKAGTQPAGSVGAEITTNGGVIR
jgi:hypothetical protein